MEAYHCAKEIVKRLVRAGYTAYFAGGWVRDHVMQHPSSDIDIATNAPPQAILDLFPQTILVGLAFGVIIVVVGGQQFEVSTFRRDVGHVNGRTPEKIELSTPEEDAYRRDFTINGMFYDPLQEIIYDYVQGVEDIKKGIIRTIGNPHERFFEDRLRMVRAVRFASRFGFIMDSETHVAIEANAEMLFPAVAMERIWQEFNKMSSYPRFEAAIIDMHRTGLLPVIFSGLKGVHLKEIKHRVSTYAHFPEDCPTILYLVELFPEAQLEELRELCRYLKVSNQETKSVEFAYRAKQLMKQERVTDIEWAYFYADARAQTVLQVVAAHYDRQEKEQFLAIHASRSKALEGHSLRIKSKKPLVAAEHLIKEGVQPGRNMGTLLKEAESLAILHNLHDKAAVMHLLKTTATWKKLVENSLD